ncbi:IS630 transposase-related protein [Synechococcus sp. PCC 6312]|uniref:IS630 transposase-related protein n=1 Tax=Synechococcus sp. (strain ATCC 27167 / PCC 6312) TaxID=195253 RepID=UPI0002E1B042
MSYSLDLRQQVIAYLQQGSQITQATNIISKIQKLQVWAKQQSSSSLVYVGKTGFDPNPTCVYG